MTLRKLAQREKKSGKRHVLSPMGDFNFAAVERLEHAPRLFTAIIAEAVEVKSQLEQDDEFIGSWYRFKIVEVVSEPTVKRQPFEGSAPVEMLPVGEDEFVLHTLGGTVTIDDVKIESYASDLPPLPLTQRYLLFLDFDKTSRVARLGMGQNSVFLIKGHSELGPLSPENQKYRQELKTKYGGSLEQFKAAMKNRSAAK
jgi:hypothetical protein